MKQIRFDMEYDGRFSYSWGYAIYSAFLEQLDNELSDKIHNDNIFNQYITPTQWIINTDSDYDFEDKYLLNKFNTKIILKNKDIINISEQELADKYLVNEPYQKRIRLRFLTPTSFKQSGEYTLFPTKDLIMKSLTNKWNNWAKRFTLGDMEWDNCKISRYDLRSINYVLKGIKIQAFVGYIDIYFWGGESLIRLGNMICNFANFSGIGIKTTLGMGGTLVE